MRPADYHDLPDILRMGREFAKSIGREIDREVFIPALERMIEDDNSLLGITEGGTVAGVLYPSFIDGQITAQELWWWVDKDQRQNGVGKILMDTFEAWAKSHGATILLATSTHALKPRIVGKIYAKRGYAPQEHVHIKRI